jgi:YCII-related domain
VTESTEITDEYMHEELGRTRVYTLVLLRPGEHYEKEGREETVWEHGRRNFSLRAEGVMPIVGPVPDDSDLAGMAVLDAPLDRAAEIMDDDPAIREGIFVYELHPVLSFPGSALPG